jgi:hypothetical protein
MARPGLEPGTPRSSEGGLATSADAETPAKQQDSTEWSADWIGPQYAGFLPLIGPRVPLRGPVTRGMTSLEPAPDREQALPYKVETSLVDLC